MNKKFSTGLRSVALLVLLCVALFLWLKFGRAGRFAVLAGVAYVMIVKGIVIVSSDCCCCCFWLVPALWPVSLPALIVADAWMRLWSPFL